MRRARQQAVFGYIKAGERCRKATAEKYTLACVAAEGTPRRSVISSSWWTTFLPGKSGLPRRTSAKMHPIDLGWGERESESEEVPQPVAI